MDDIIDVKRLNAAVNGQLGQVAEKINRVLQKIPLLRMVEAVRFKSGLLFDDV